MRTVCEGHRPRVLLSRPDDSICISYRTFLLLATLSQWVEMARFSPARPMSLAFNATRIVEVARTMSASDQIASG